MCADTLNRQVPSVGFQPLVRAKRIAKVRRSIGLIFAMLLFLAGCAQSIQLHSVDWGGESVDLPAWLSMPSGKGPFPAVVLMHGCGGLATARNITEWAGWFNSRGYAALAIDSFTGRGISNVCSGGYAGGPAGSFSRVPDARAALKYLTDNPMIDSKRVVLVGFSHGGLTVLMATLERPIIPYAAVIAFYPYCSGTGTSNGFTVPTLILIGEKDDWTPADGCKVLAHDAKGPIELHVYPGAYHGFDHPGSVVIAYGHRMGGDLQTTWQARTDVENFLAKLGLSAM